MTDLTVEARLDEMESRLAFQDDLIESLNEVIARQDRELARLQLTVQALSDKLGDIGESAGVAAPSPEQEVPPHY